MRWGEQIMERWRGERTVRGERGGSGEWRRGGVE